MPEFEESQRLFDIYQKTGDSQNLRDSLDILNSIIESETLAHQKAINFKKTIYNYINDQINVLKTKYNIGEFSKKSVKSPSEDIIQKLLSAVFASATNQDAKKLIDLMIILVEYWK